MQQRNDERVRGQGVRVGWDSFWLLEGQASGEGIAIEELLMVSQRWGRDNDLAKLPHPQWVGC